MLGMNPAPNELNALTGLRGAFPLGLDGLFVSIIDGKVRQFVVVIAATNRVV